MAGPQVLLIDAEKDFSQQIVESVQSWGYECNWVVDGKEGLDRAAADRPAAIVLCVELPKMSGYSICNKLKKDDGLKDIPLIITSREATQETFEQHKKLKTRAEAYLIKPFQPEELHAVLQQLAPGGASGETEEDIMLDDLPAGSKEEAFDPGTVAEEEAKEKDPFSALDGISIGEDEPDERAATRVMTVTPEMRAQIAAAKPRAAEPTAKPAPAARAAAPVSVQSGTGASTAAARPAPAGKPVSDDERRQLETKLQEAKQKAAQSAAEVDKLRAEMNQLRTKSREDASTLRTQIQELTEKLKHEQQALKQRYDEANQKTAGEASTLRQQIKDTQARAQSEIENLRSQVIETRNQSQELLQQKDSELASLKKRAAELEALAQQLKAEKAQHDKVRDKTLKAVDVALQLLADV